MIVFGNAPTSWFVTSCVPSGLRIDTNEIEMVMFVSEIVTGRPACPANVTRPFCPGVVIEIGCAGPPTASEAEASAGTLYSVTIAKPVASL